MTLNDGFDRIVSDWLDEEAEWATPGYLDEILAATVRAPQRTAWSSLERWLPLATTFRVRLAPAPGRFLALAVLGALLLAAVFLALAGSGRPHLPVFGAQANGHIAFVDGNNLLLAAADGTGATSVLALPKGATALRFSPDGTHLVYRTDESAPSIVVVDADGTHPATVSTGMSVADGGPIAWAPDSRRIVFTGIFDDRRDLVLADADGAHLARLGEDAMRPLPERFGPAWSPDGRWISFFAPEADGYVGLYVVHPDGTSEQRLATSPLHPEIFDTSWAPDPAQSRLVYVAGGYVKLFDLATSTETTVGAGFWPTWSPDATRISRWDRGTVIATVDDILAGRRRTVTPFPAVGGSCGSHPDLAGRVICSPAEWSPDGHWVLGPDVVGSSIVVGSVDGSEPIRVIPLEHPFGAEGPGPFGAQRSGRQYAWQPVAP
jgi:hypothetical protein